MLGLRAGFAELRRAGLAFGQRAFGGVEEQQPGVEGIGGEAVRRKTAVYLSWWRRGSPSRSSWRSGCPAIARRRSPPVETCTPSCSLAADARTKSALTSEARPYGRSLEIALRQGDHGSAACVDEPPTSTPSGLVASTHADLRGHRRRFAHIVRSLVRTDVAAPRRPWLQHKRGRPRRRRSRQPTLATLSRFMRSAITCHQRRRLRPHRPLVWRRRSLRP